MLKRTRAIGSGPDRPSLHRKNLRNVVHIEVLLLQSIGRDRSGEDLFPLYAPVIENNYIFIKT